jgi:hypothetical protein
MRSPLGWVVSLLVSLAAAGAPQRRLPASPQVVRFSGRVVDAHGRPAPGAALFVSLMDASAGADPAQRPTISRTQAAGDGSFHLAVPVPQREWSPLPAAQLDAGSVHQRA